MSMDRAISYKVETMREWGETIAKTFRYAPGEGGWTYFGACPRCGHETTTSVRRGFIQKAITLKKEPPEPVFLEELPVECSCGQQHAPDKTGCGAYAVVYNVAFE
jgi:hypothetical protein